MPLSDENACVMNTLRQTTLEHLGLQPPLQEILNLESQHVIKAHSRLVEHTYAYEPTDESVAFKESFWVFCVELEEFTGGTTDFG
jgi:hypothetical protein